MTTEMPRNGQSIYRIAKKAGLSYSTVRDLASGTNNPRRCSIETFHALSVALGVSMDSLYKNWIEPSEESSEKIRSERIPEKFQKSF